jgi:cell division protein FtsL
LANRKKTHIIVDGKSYAVGIFWQPLSSQKNLKKEILKAQTIVEGADLYCIKKGTSSQFGLGFTKEGHRAGELSAAAAVASAFRDKSSLIAVFKVKEGYWMIVIRNDLILPEEDTLYENEEDAKNAYNEMMAVPDWGYKIAPKAWNLNDTSDADISQILKKHASAKLEKISFQSPLIKLSIISALIIFAAWYGYQKLIVEPEQELIKRQKKQAELMKKQQKEQKMEQKQQVQEIKQRQMRINLTNLYALLPWNNLKNIFTLSKNCYNQTVNFSAIIPGWNLTEVECRPDLITASWIKGEYGNIEGIEYAQKTRPTLKDINFNIDNNHDRMSATTEIQTPEIQDDPKLTVEQIKNNLAHIFKNRNIKVSITEKNEEIKSNLLPKDLKIEYNYVIIKYSSVIEPEKWAELLVNKLTAIEFEDIRWDNNAKRWHYEGKIYAKSEKGKTVQDVVNEYQQRIAEQERIKRELEAKRNQENSK